MSRQDLQDFLTRLAPDADTGWQWLREMHEEGFEYVGSTGTGGDGVFTSSQGQYVCQSLRAGKVVWVASWHQRPGKASEATGHTFEAPGGALAWMKIEQSNEPSAPMDTTKKASQMAWPGGPPGAWSGSSPPPPPAAPVMPMPAQVYPRQTAGLTATQQKAYDDAVAVCAQTAPWRS